MFESVPEFIEIGGVNLGVKRSIIRYHRVYNCVFLVELHTYGSYLSPQIDSSDRSIRILIRNIPRLYTGIMYLLLFYEIKVLTMLVLTQTHISYMLVVMRYTPTGLKLLI